MYVRLKSCAAVVICAADHESKPCSSRWALTWDGCLQVHLLNAEHNPDVMLLAARAITFLADVLPSSCSSIVRHGAVPAFCARLLTIEYIDLAEQSLQVSMHTVIAAACVSLPAHCLEEWAYH